MITRKEAKRRLMARYYAQLADLPRGTEPLFGLKHFLSDETIAATQRLNLYGSYSDREQRDRDIVAAWCRPDEGRRH
jgi:hypothetical protein